MRNLVIVLLVISSLIFLISLFSYFSFVSDVKRITYPAFVVLSENVNGFDLNGTALTFGSIVLSGSSRRQVLVRNPYPYSVIVTGEVFGDIGKLFLEIPITVVSAFNESSIPLAVWASPDKNLSLGNYSGTVVFTLRRV